MQAISTLWAGLATDQLGWTLQQVSASVGFLGIMTTGAWIIFQARTRQSLAPRSAEGSTSRA